QRDDRTARRAPGCRPGDGAEDPRLPRAARWLRLGRRTRCGSRDRAGTARGPARTGGAVTEFVQHRYPQLVAAALCCGLALANAVRVGTLVVLLLSSVLLVVPRRLAFALALAIAGWWWGSARLDRLDYSALATHVGEAG